MSSIHQCQKQVCLWDLGSRRQLCFARGQLKDMEWDDCRAVITPHHKYPTPPQMDMNCIVLLNTDAGKCRIMTVAYLFATICYALDCWPNSISFVLDLAFERVQCFARINVTCRRATAVQSQKDLHDRTRRNEIFRTQDRSHTKRPVVHVTRASTRSRIDLRSFINYTGSYDRPHGYRTSHISPF